MPTFGPPAASVPKLCTGTQSQVVAHVVFQPLTESHTLLPAATQWLVSWTSAWNGAMKRADGSQSAPV